MIGAGIRRRRLILRRHRDVYIIAGSQRAIARRQTQHPHVARRGVTAQRQCAAGHREILSHVDGYNSRGLDHRAAVEIESIREVVRPSREIELAVPVNGEGAVVARRNVDRQVRCCHI